jgi:hypothetical protein
MIDMLIDWRKLIANAPADNELRFARFREAVSDVANHTGSEQRGDAVAELKDLALGHNYFGRQESDIERTITEGLAGNESHDETFDEACRRADETAARAAGNGQSKSSVDMVRASQASTWRTPS